MKWFCAVFLCVSFIFLSVFGMNCFYGYLFPIRFQEEVKIAGEKFNIGEDVIYSIINVESHFNTDVVSSKGAVGLMQILPSTAKEMADKISLKEYDLKNSKDNILLGTSYFAELLSQFQDFDNAVLAYNAGPANVKNWLKDERFCQDGKVVSNIPFSETKNYLAKVKENLNYYKTKV